MKNLAICQVLRILLMSVKCGMACVLRSHWRLHLFCYACHQLSPFELSPFGVRVVSMIGAKGLKRERSSMLWCPNRG